MKVREPVARPLDVVAVELLLSASQAFLVGVLMYLAIGVWDDRGMGFGPAAIILALLGLAVGAGWLYWLLGGVGWPLAAADVPVAMFLAFALALSWLGDDLFHVRGVPLLLAVAAAVYGIVCGVFLDSPRRWRWDQRQKLRPGTPVPRVSPTTQALAAQVPRSLPKRSGGDEAGSDLAARIEHSTPLGPEPGGDAAVSHADAAGASGARAAAAGQTAPRLAVSAAADAPLTDAPDVEGAPITASEPTGSMMPTERLGRGALESDASALDDDDDAGGIELPTAIEPRAQRSPWAWAAPPEWNRDEDDEATSGSSSKRS